MNIRILPALALTAVTAGMLFGSCKDKFLDQPPQGVYDEASLTNKKGLNGILINTYATLDGVEATWYGGASNWVWGSVTGGDAYKGSEFSDQTDVNPVMRFAEISPGNPIILNKWVATWDGVGQANQVLRVVTKVTDMTDAEKLQATAEARFIRGHHHFEAKKMWKNVPFVDENVTDFRVPNIDGSGNYIDIWPQIEADLKFAYDNLDEVKPNRGRVNKWAAGAYLAKAYMFQNKFNEAKALYDVIIPQGKNSLGVAYNLAPNYGANFRVTSEHNAETVFAIEASYGDGSNTNGNYDNALNYPHNAGPKPGGCCGFFQPSQSFVNSFKTTGGLPQLTTFNATNVTSDEGQASTDPFTPYAGTLDPRLDWSVGRRGIPYYDWGIHPGRDWIRKVDFGGPYSPKKNTYYQADQGSTAGVVGWGWANNALNYTIMRFADVLLMAAEAEIEVGSLETARTYINRVRTRAANSVIMNGANPAANYQISNYTTPFADKPTARDIVRFERKLELGMEGHRFFDLVRWGIAAQEIQAYLAIESVRRSPALGGAAFTPGKNEYYPIPDFAISQSVKDGVPTLKQNPNW